MLIRLAIITVLSLVPALGAMAEGGWYGVHEAETRPKATASKAYRSPFSGIKKVAIVPFRSMNQYVDGMEFSNEFAGIIESMGDWEAIYPQITQQVADANKIPLVSIHDALSVARLLKVDAVVLGEIRDFEPFHPPRIVLKTAMYRTRLQDRHQDILRLSQSGIADAEIMHDPNQSIWEYSGRLDARSKKVQSMIAAYAKKQDMKQVPFGTARYTREKVKFYEVISHIISLNIQEHMKHEGRRERKSGSERYWSRRGLGNDGNRVAMNNHDRRDRRGLAADD